MMQQDDASIDDLRFRIMIKERESIMKKRIYIIALLSLLSIAGYAVNYTPTQEWKTTSPMLRSGSAYSPQVTEVGAAYAASEATTTDTYSPNNAPSGPRREKIIGPDTKPADEFPVGEPWIMAALAIGFAGVIWLRRKRKVRS